MAKMKVEPKRYKLTPRILSVEVRVIVGEFNAEGLLVRGFPLSEHPAVVSEADLSDVFKESWVQAKLKQVTDLREVEASANAAGK